MSKERKKIIQDMITWNLPSRGTLTASEECMVIESLLITIIQRPQDFSAEGLKKLVPKQYTEVHPDTPEIYKKNAVANIMWNLQRRSSELVMKMSGFVKEE